MHAKLVKSGQKLYQLGELLKALVSSVFNKSFELVFRAEAYKQSKVYTTLYCIANGTAGGDRIVDIKVPFNQAEVIPTKHGNLPLIGILLAAIPDNSNVKCRLYIEHNDTRSYLVGNVSFYSGTISVDGTKINFADNPFSFNCQINKRQQIEAIAGIEAKLLEDSLPEVDTSQMTPAQVLSQIVSCKADRN